MAVGLGTAVGYLNLDITGFANGIDSAVSDMSRLEGSFSTASQGLQSIGGMFTKAGTALTAGFTAPITGAIAASVKFGAEFDKSMSNVKAVTGATGKEFDALREAAISWGEKTKYTAAEASDALYYMGLAGWDSQEAIAGLGPVLSLASAGDLDLARTSDIVTDAMSAFNLEAKDTEKFTNILAATMSNSNTDVDMLGESFKYVASVAGAFNYKAEDVAVALGLFANNGVKASQAGTGLRQALNALTKPSDEAAAMMDKYGVSLFNADGSTKDFMTVMEELRGTFGNVSLNAGEISTYLEDLGLNLDTAEGQAAATDAIMEKFGHDLPTTDMENLNALVTIFGVRALPGMLSVINASEEDFYGLAEKIYGADAAFVKFGDEIYTIDEALEKFGDRIYTDDSFEILGAAAGMAAVQLDNLSGDWEIFKSAIGTAQILISDMVKGALRELVQKLTELVVAFNNLDVSQREQILKWAAIIAAIGPVLLAIGGLISGIGRMINTFNTLKAAFDFVRSGFANFATGFSTVGTSAAEATGIMGKLGAAIGGISAPVVAAVAIIGTLVAAFVNLWNTNEDFRNRIIEIWNGIKAKFEEAGQRIVEIFNELGFTFEDFEHLMSVAIEGLKALWDGFCEFLAPIFVGAIEIIGDVINGIVDLFVGVIEVIVGIVKGFKDGDWSMLWQGIGDIVSTIVDTIISILDHLGEAVWGVIQTVANWLGADWNMSWEEAKQAVADWFDSVVQWITDLPGKIAEFFSNVWQTISNFISSVGEWIASIPGKVGELISSVGESISSFISNVIQWFSELPGKIASFFTTIWSNVTQWASDMISKAGEVGSGFLNSVVQFFSQLPNQIAYLIGYALGSVVKWVADMIAKAKEVGSGFLEAVVSFFTQLPGKISEFISNALSNVVKWAADMSSKAKEMGSEFLENVISFFTKLPGEVLGFINSTLDNVKKWAADMAKKAKEAGEDFLNKVVEFIQKLPGKVKEHLDSVIEKATTWVSDMKKKAEEGAKGFLDKVVEFLRDLPGKVKEKLDSAIEKITSWVSDMKQKATEAAQGFISNIVSGLASLPSQMASIGSNVVQGIWSGISSGWSWLKQQVSSLASSLVQGAKDALGVHSPSTVFRDQVGKWIPPGIAEGFAQAMPAAIRDIEDNLNDGINSLELDDIDAGNNSLEVQLNNFADEYKQVFEGLVIWFEAMDERMSIVIESLTDYFKYLMHVKQSLGDDEFRVFMFSRNEDNKTRKSADVDVSNNQSSGGDTINIYSPKPVDVVQAARILKNTKRDLAEGF